MANESDALDLASMKRAVDREMFVATQRYNAALIDYQADVVACNHAAIADDIKRAHAALDLQLAALRATLELQWLAGAAPPANVMRS